MREQISGALILRQRDMVGGVSERGLQRGFRIFMRKAWRGDSVSDRAHESSARMAGAEGNGEQAAIRRKKARRETQRKAQRSWEIFYSSRRSVRGLQSHGTERRRARNVCKTGWSGERVLEPLQHRSRTDTKAKIVTMFQSQRVIGRLPSSCGLLIPWGASPGRLDYLCVVDGAHTTDEGTMPLEIHVSSILCVVVAFGVEGCFGVRRGILATTAPRG
jgi:hypothetical protein